MIKELFEKNEDEYLKFDRIENKPSGRPDMCAFLLLDKLVPGNRDLISSAGHDVYYFDIPIEEIEKFSEETVIYLRRCGISYDGEAESLYSFA